MRVFAILSVFFLVTGYLFVGRAEQDYRGEYLGSAQRGRFGKAIELRVGPRLISGVNQTTGVEVKFRQSTLMLPSGQEKSLAAPIMHTGERAQGLMLKVSNAQGIEQQIRLPAKLKERLREYLSWGPDRRPFDCGSFVHFLYEIPYQPGNFDSRRWVIQPLSTEQELRVGDAILLSDRSSDWQNPVHFAVYLADGLYLSKFGNIGGLIVTDLAQMRVGFGGVSAFRILPKQALVRAS